jgi:hypothetical protein
MAGGLTGAAGKAEGGGKVNESKVMRKMAETTIKAAWIVGRLKMGSRVAVNRK